MLNKKESFMNFDFIRHVMAVCGKLPRM
jgi:hypothetical protein